MSEVLTILEESNVEKRDIDLRFEEIVSSIEQAALTLTPEEKEDLVMTPQMKPAGSMDQGYRHD